MLQTNPQSSLTELNKTKYFRFGKFWRAQAMVNGRVLLSNGGEYATDYMLVDPEDLYFWTEAPELFD